MRHLKTFKRDEKLEEFWKKYLESCNVANASTSTNKLLGCYRFKNYEIVNDFFVDETGEYDHISLSSSNGKLEEDDVNIIIKRFFGDADTIEKHYSKGLPKQILNVYNKIK